jgi:GNAT superfamily N-acetyltransferase
VSDGYLVRPATSRDVPEVARLHVDAWRATYRGLIHEAALFAHSYAEREALWNEALEAGSVTSLFVAESDGAVAGFAACGPTREPEPGFDGELYAIYLRTDYQGRGIGRALVETARSCLRQRGFQKMILWVLDGNAGADAFYERLGGRRQGTGSFELCGESLIEHGFAFDT